VIYYVSLFAEEALSFLVAEEALFSGRGGGSLFWPPRRLSFLAMAMAMAVASAK